MSAPFVGMFAQNSTDPNVTEKSVTTVETSQGRDFFRDSLRVSDKRASATTFMKNGFWDNWFISVGGGASVLMSEQTRYLDVTDVIKPSVMFSVGKWINPVVGVRLNATAAELKGFAEWHKMGNSSMNLGLGDWYVGTNRPGLSDILPNTNTYINANDPKYSAYIEEHFLNMDDPYSTSKGNGYSYDFKYAAASLDMMINFTNLFCKYNPDRFFNFSAILGAGYSHTFREKERTAVNLVMAKTALQANFRLSKQMTLDLEPQLLILPEIFDRRSGDGNTMDGVASLYASLTYRFKDRNFYEPAYTNRQVTVMNTIINEAKPVPPVIEKVDIEHLRVVVHFVIDKWNVRPTEMYKLDEIAKFMEKYPKARISISGYADVQTAYPAYNMKLSDRRANEVAKILNTKYGIDKSRMRISYYGDTVQPFDINELNRAVIAFDIED